MSSLESFASYNNIASLAVDKALKVMETSGLALVRNGQEMQVLLADQAQASSKRALFSLQQITKSTDIAEASKAYASYLTESSRAHAENLVSWTQILLRSCSAMSPAVVARPDATAGAQPNVT